MLKYLPFLILLFLCSCQKDNTISDPIIGEWQLTQTNFDIGDGTVISSPVSDGPTIEFKANGRYHANTPTCQAFNDSGTPSEGKYDTDQQRLIPADCEDFDLRYTMVNDTLWISPPCIEYCSYRFDRL